VRDGRGNAKGCSEQCLERSWPVISGNLFAKWTFSLFMLSSASMIQMMFSQIRSVHFVGICGTAMASTAAAMQEKAANRNVARSRIVPAPESLTGAAT